MMRKRMAKLETAGKEIPTPFKFKLHGPASADLTLVGWGTTKGAILDAMSEIEAQGRSVNFLQIRMMRPFPAADVSQILGAARTVVLIEGNFSGQLGALVREHTGRIWLTGSSSTMDGHSHAMRSSRECRPRSASGRRR